MSVNPQWLKRQLEYDEDFNGDEWFFINLFLFMIYAFVDLGFAWLFWTWQLIAILLIVTGVHMAIAMFINYEKSTKSKKG